jgi:hypothetical protein
MMDDFEWMRQGFKNPASHQFDKRLRARRAEQDAARDFRNKVHAAAEARRTGPGYAPTDVFTAIAIGVPIPRKHPRAT